jgi:hypothetical protein
MKKYVMTSTQFEGEITFEYGDSGLLRSLTTPDDFSGLQLSFLLSHVPSTVERMKGFIEFLKEMNSQATVREIVKEVTFDEFWNRYFKGRGSDNSSKKKARTRWERMSMYDRVKAYEYIPRYLNKIPVGVGIKLAETYLNSEVWER